MRFEKRIEHLRNAQNDIVGWEPKNKDDDEHLYKWMKDQRYLFKMRWLKTFGMLDGTYQKRYQMFVDLGIDILSSRKSCETIDYELNYNDWMTIADNQRMTKKVDDVEKEMCELDAYLKNFESKKYHVVLRNQYRSVAEYTLRQLNVGDISPINCLPRPGCDQHETDIPMSSMKWCLHYFLHPYQPTHPPIDPCWRAGAGATSVYFGPEKVKTDEIVALMNQFIASLPDFVRERYPVEKEENGKQASNAKRFKNKKEAQEWVLHNLNLHEGKWFARLFINKNGTNTKGGAININKSKNPGPRRLHLSRTIHRRRYNKVMKCHLKEGYGYAYPGPRCFMSMRFLNDYPGVIELVEAVWKRFHHHLSAVSRQCPPNVVDLLWYFGAFNSTIRPHRDNNPNGPKDWKQNSQMLGSSVMIITFFDSQEFQFMELGKTGKKVASIGLEHMSCYILNPEDDVKWKHTVKYGTPDPSKKGKVRLAIAARWSSRRQEAFCEDRDSFQQFQEHFKNVERDLRSFFTCPHTLNNYSSKNLSQLA